MAIPEPIALVDVGAETRRAAAARGLRAALREPDRVPRRAPHDRVRRRRSARRGGRWPTPGLHHLYLDQDFSATLAHPGHPGHLLGTDQYGRDLLWRTVAGTGISLLVGVAATSATLVLGLTLGCIAGYFGGIVDRLISGLIDLTWGFPLLLVAVVYAGMLEPGLTAVVLAIGTVVWAGFARIVRAQVRSLREREFIEAARALGTPAPKIILRHLVPNVMGTVLVMASYYVAITRHLRGRLLVHRPGSPAADAEPRPDDRRRAELLLGQHLACNRARGGDRADRPRP